MNIAQTFASTLDSLTYGDLFVWTFIMFFVVCVPALVLFVIITWPLKFFGGILR